VRFRLWRKTPCQFDGHMGIVVNSLSNLEPPRIIYGDGIDPHETVFCIETADQAVQLIGTYGGFTRFLDGITARLFEWIDDNSRMDWLGYPPAENKGKGAGNGGQDNG
jgi:hypothetical protein